MATETYREWNLRGQPNGHYPPYDVTVRDGAASQLIEIARKIQSGEYPWESAELTTRTVTVETTEWVPVEPCTYTHSHTRHWCGNPGCRES